MNNKTVTSPTHLLLLLTFIFLPPCFGFDHTHQAWDSILKQSVQLKDKQALVDYTRLKNKSTSLDKYLNSLSAVTLTSYQQFKSKQKLAFLINAYNAFTIKLVLSEYPVKSIKKLGGFFSSPWKKEFFQLLGKERHLDWIEHEVIRIKFNEPRVHFAINCASISCPNLLREAFTSSKLEKQLDSATRFFLNDKNKNELKIKRKRLFLSKIFDWYEEDFIKTHGSVANFVANYMTQDPAEQSLMRSGQVKIKYQSYNWDLNSL